MRVIGLDYGTKTVGVAISDETKLIAQPLVTIERKQANKLRQTYAAIESIITEQDVELIVLGNPKNMNNTEGERVQATKEFKEAYDNYLFAAERAKDRDIRAQGHYYAGSLDFARGRLSYAETNFKRSITNARDVSEITYTKLIGVLLRQEKYGEVLKYVSRLKKLQHLPL